MFAPMANTHLVSTKEKTIKPKKSSTNLFGRRFRRSKDPAAGAEAQKNKKDVTPSTKLNADSKNQSKTNAGSSTSPLDVVPNIVQDVVPEVEPEVQELKVRPSTEAFLQEIRQHIETDENISSLSMAPSILTASTDDSSILTRDSDTEPTTTCINGLPFGFEMPFPNATEIDNSFISSQIEKLITDNPNLSLDLNFLKKSLINHEAEVTEIRNSFDVRLAKRYWKERDMRMSQEKQLEIKNMLLKSGLERFDEFEQMIATLKKSKNELLERQKLLENESVKFGLFKTVVTEVNGKLTAENLRLRKLVIDLQGKLKSKSKSRKESKNQGNQDHEKLKSSMQQKFQEEKKNLEVEIQLLRENVQDKENRIMILEAAKDDKKAFIDRMQQAYIYYQNYWNKQNELYEKFFIDNNTAGQEYGLAGSGKGKKVASFGGNTLEERRASMFKYASGTLTKHYESLQRSGEAGDPDIGREFLLWVEEQCHELELDANMQRIGLDYPNDDISQGFTNGNDGNSYISAYETTQASGAGYGGEIGDEIGASMSVAEFLAQVPSPLMASSSLSAGSSKEEGSLIDLDLALPEKDSPTLGHQHY